MFVVSEAEAAAIRAVFEQHGEFAAAIELRRLFPAVTGRRAGPAMRPDHCRLEAAARAAVRGAAGAPDKTRSHPTGLIADITRLLPRIQGLFDEVRHMLTEARREMWARPIARSSPRLPPSPDAMRPCKRADMQKQRTP